MTLTLRQQFLLKSTTIEKSQRGGTYVRRKGGNTLGLVDLDSLKTQEKIFKEKIGAVWVKITARSGSWGDKVTVEAIFKEELPRIKEEKAIAQQWARENPIVFRKVWFRNTQGYFTEMMPFAEVPERYGVSEWHRPKESCSQRRYRSGRRYFWVRVGKPGEYRIIHVDEPERWPREHYLLTKEEWEAVNRKPIEFFDFSDEE